MVELFGKNWFSSREGDILYKRKNEKMALI